MHTSRMMCRRGIRTAPPPWPSVEVNECEDDDGEEGVDDLGAIVIWRFTSKCTDCI